MTKDTGLVPPEEYAADLGQFCPNPECSQPHWLDLSDVWLDRISGGLGAPQECHECGTQWVATWRLSGYTGGEVPDPGPSDLFDFVCTLALEQAREVRAQKQESGVLYN